MALWKPFRGNRANLDVVEKHDGYIYFCTDDGSLFFDFIDADGNLQRKQVSAYGEGAKPRFTTVTLLADNWTGDANPWSQAVELAALADDDRVELCPSAEQIVLLQEEEISLVAANDNSVLTIFAIGNKPSFDITMQILLTSVIFI